jgi:hypothetical protein
MFFINSPLTLFEVSDLFGVSAPILGHLNIIITNIALYTFLIIILVISLHYYGNNDSKIIPNNWSIFIAQSPKDLVISKHFFIPRLFLLLHPLSRFPYGRVRGGRWGVRFYSSNTSKNPNTPLKVLELESKINNLGSLSKNLITQDILNVQEIDESFNYIIIYLILSCSYIPKKKYNEILKNLRLNLIKIGLDKNYLNKLIELLKKENNKNLVGHLNLDENILFHKYSVLLSELSGLCKRNTKINLNY